MTFDTQTFTIFLIKQSKTDLTGQTFCSIVMSMGCQYGVSNFGLLNNAGEVVRPKIAMESISLMKDLSTIRFCLIGVGRAGLIHAGHIHERVKDAQMVALCDTSEKALSEHGQELGVDLLFTDYKQACACPEVDAVIIVTPTFLHCQIATEAARRGKHIFLEKPMAITTDECHQINAEVEKAGVKLQIGFMRRFDEGFMQAKQLLDTGELGRVKLIKSTGRGPGGPGPWMYDLTQSNGILAEVNSHDFDSVRWLADSDIKRVYAEGENFDCDEARRDYPDFYDNAVVSLRFETGALGCIDGACPAHYGYDARVEILCEKGMISIGYTSEQNMTVVNLNEQSIRKPVKTWRKLFKPAYLAEIEHFIECVRENRTPRVSGEDGLKAVEAVIAANRSMKEGRPVELKEGVLS